MAVIKCPECGREISDKARACPQCGYPLSAAPINETPLNVPPENATPINATPIYVSQINIPTLNVKTEIIKEKGKWATGKLVIGIISVVLFLFISLQSCAVGLGNALSDNGEVSGSFGILVALFMMVAGIVGIVSRNSRSKGGSIACCILYGMSSLSAYVGAGTYSDLKIWGFLSFVFGYIFLLSIMNKKIQIIICSICAFVFLFLLMGKGSTSDTSSTSGTKEITNVDSTKIENEVEVEAAAESLDSADDSENTDSAVNTDSTDSTSVTIKEQVLFEQDGLKITATEMINDSIWGKGIKVLIENNTDKDLGIGCNALIVNNYMITDLFASSVAAGKKANETIYISSSELEAAGIENIGEIEIYFNIYDNASYETIFDAEGITIQTSDYTNMDTKTMGDGTELLNQDGIKIMGKYVDENSFWGAAVLLHIENTSGNNVSINCSNMSINGYMVTPYFSSTVYDGKMALDDITILSTDLENNNIDSVDEIELTFEVYDNDTYDTLLESEPITFKAQ